MSDYVNGKVEKRTQGGSSKAGPSRSRLTIWDHWSTPMLCHCHGLGKQEPRFHEGVVGTHTAGRSSLSQLEKAYIYEKDYE